MGGQILSQENEDLRDRFIEAFGKYFPDLQFQKCKLSGDVLVFDACLGCLGKIDEESIRDNLYERIMFNCRRWQRKIS